STASVTIEANGDLLVEAGSQEIGTGVYTIMPQIAADTLGVPVARARMLLGDTTLPETAGTFGSSTTMGVGSAVLDAATKLKQKFAELAGDEVPPEAYADLLARSGLERLSADGAWSPGPNASMLGEV